MPPGEIRWRIAGKLRDQVGRFQLDRAARAADRPAHRDAERRPVTVSLRPPMTADRLDANCTDQLLSYADALCRNRLSIFNLDRVDVSPAINWNYDYSSRRSTPLTYAPRIDYRDYATVGDAKFVWEPNRHQHLVVLGRAFCVTGDRRYAQTLVDQMASWMDACPYGRGMNWRSPLELAIRLVNWAWALDLIRDSDLPSSQLWHRILASVRLHLREITRKYSRYSSANNHLIGEAAGVFIASRFFATLNNAATWAADSHRILTREIDRQTHADGGNREQALGYHMFVIEFFVLAGLAGRRTGMDFPKSYWRRLEAMFDYLAAFVEGGDHPPMYGDCDDGYVLDCGGWPDRPRALLGVGAALFDRPDLGRISRGVGEPAHWLLGDDTADRMTARLAIEPSEMRISSRALDTSGYYLLQTGCVTPDGDDRLSVILDCGTLGFGSLAAHGHADALSFTLRAYGEDILVDPGTYDYFTHPQWRAYFRGTRAHNTVLIDERDQSQMTGPFLWGERAAARCVEWRPTEDGGSVLGEHNGYAGLSDPVIHQRRVQVSGSGGLVSITDHLRGRADHTAVMYLHFAENVRVDPLGHNCYRARSRRGEATIEFAHELSVTSVRGSEAPIQGWVSRAYHHKAPSTTLVGRWAFAGESRVVTHIRVQPVAASSALWGEKVCRAT